MVTSQTPSFPERLDELARVWHEDAMFLSDINKTLEHPSKDKIVAMGEPVLPYIFDRLESDPRLEWFTVLTLITGIDIEDVAGRCETLDSGNVAWLDWAAKNGYR